MFLRCLLGLVLGLFLIQTNAEPWWAAKKPPEESTQSPSIPWWQRERPSSSQNLPHQPVPPLPQVVPLPPRGDVPFKGNEPGVWGMFLFGGPPQTFERFADRMENWGDRWANRIDSWGDRLERWTDRWPPNTMPQTPWGYQNIPRSLGKQLNPGLDPGVMPWLGSEFGFDGSWFGF
ncbi:hypothetical protein CCP3SC1AL1_50031 [Gammaproteobacteria bacterium]